MKENFRLFFSIVWIFATGAVLASAFLVLFTWGDHWNYVEWSLALWAIATAGNVVTAL